MQNKLRRVTSQTLTAQIGLDRPKNTSKLFASPRNCDITIRLLQIVLYTLIGVLELPFYTFLKSLTLFMGNKNNLNKKESRNDCTSRCRM